MIETKLVIKNIEGETICDNLIEIIEIKKSIKIKKIKEKVTFIINSLINNFNKVKTINLKSINKDLVKNRIEIFLKKSTRALFIASFIGITVYSFLVIRVLNIEKSKVVELTSVVSNQNATIGDYQTKVTVLEGDLATLKISTENVNKSFNTLIAKSAELEKAKKVVIPK